MTLSRGRRPGVGRGSVPIAAGWGLCDDRGVETTPAPPTRSTIGAPASRSPVARSRDDRVVAGVAAGLAGRIGVDPVLVRLAFGVLALALGVGLVAYLVLWALLPEGDGTPPGATAEGEAAEHSVAVALITTGSLLLVQRLSPWFPGHLVWPAAVAATGLGLAWVRTGEAERTRWRGYASRLPDPVDALADGRGLVVRAGAGIVLVLVGVGSLFATSGSITAFGQVAVTMVATAAGVALLLGPWIVRLARQLGVERRERIRSEERAEVAAHLHDSVLQTLALIQRTADSPHETVSLARRQERELRAWLYGARSPTASTVAAALDGVVTEVEARHDVTVEVVTVGDGPLDERRAALVGRGARGRPQRRPPQRRGRGVGVRRVRAEATTAFVRDRGSGFDVARVPPDRRGIADSIVGRTERHGGRAEIHSAPGDGTEVALGIPAGGR
jgi:phage shock protein PspC (stress-responsive transcriptional regulator)